MCARAGLPAVNVHAGEHCLQAANPIGAELDEAVLALYVGPGYVRQAVEAGAARIGHGIETANDPALMAELAEKMVCLEVCMVSNREHPYLSEKRTYDKRKAKVESSRIHRIPI